MTDIPILFSAPMILALIAGRKTQTRRPLYTIGKHTDGGRRMFRTTPSGEDLPYHPPGRLEALEEQWNLSRWPKAKPGDRLWVRESISAASNDQGGRWFSYAADGKEVWPITEWTRDRNAVPSIHMPRWASRLTLVITANRIERLQDISEADAIAEGWPYPLENLPKRGGMMPASETRPNFWYSGLWTAINGPGSWSQNPWVSVLSFEVQKRNIDSEAA